MNNNIEIKDLYYKYLNTESTTLNNINLDGDVDLGIDRDLSFKFDSSKNPDEIDINFNNISKYGESFYGEYGENPKYTIKAVSDIGNVKIEYR
ncbi:MULTISPECIES: hypothetical protein [Clostridia]|uniref:hypothetical protein n=1 Tax=Clostridia TaxID=186801 RepID=UPI0018A9F5D1|nr:hypothetical protein [Clostridium sp. 1001270J_160509_D11]